MIDLLKEIIESAPEEQQYNNGLLSTSTCGEKSVNLYFIFFKNKKW